MANEAHEATIEELNTVAIEQHFRSFYDLDDQSQRLNSWHRNMMREWVEVESCVAKIKGWENKLPGEEETKARRKQYGERVDKDSRSYVDHNGNTCRAWQGYDCDHDLVDFGYTEAQQRAIKKNCAESCAIYGGLSKNSKNDYWWVRSSSAQGMSQEDLENFIVPINPYEGENRKERVLRAQRIFDFAVSTPKCAKKAKDYVSMTWRCAHGTRGTMRKR